MGLFDKGFGGLLNSDQFAIPDHMAGIKEGLAQNAMTSRKPGLFGSGSKLWDVLGVLGDAATGQTGYAQSVWNRQEMERREKLRQQELLQTRSALLGLEELRQWNLDPTY